MGEKRTLRMAAQWANGWNAAYISPDEFGRLCGVLDGHCETVGRDPADIERSINVMFDLGKETAELEAQWGPMWERVSGGSLHGSVEQVIDRIGAYRDAGAGGLNIALRAPVDTDLLDTYLHEIAPALRAS